MPSTLSPSPNRGWIFERLRRPGRRVDEPEFLRYAHPPGRAVVPAAVLVPLVGRPQGVTVLLTQRTSHLHDHAGQISFPGGRVEPEDPGREVTALRETEEEIGLARDRIEVLGRLPLYEVPSGFRITPVVGWIEAPLALQLDPFEVAEVFEVPVEHFLRPGNYVRRAYDFRGRHRHYMAVPYEGRYIWGATAGMLYTFCRAMLAAGE